MKRIAIGCVLALFLGAFVYCTSGAARVANDRRAAEKARESGNYKDAYDAFARLALDPNDDPQRVDDDFQGAISGLQQLGRIDEIDDFREAVIKAHPNNWRLLRGAAQSCLAQHQQGHMIAGKFHRGPHRGNDGKPVSCAERDRVRALQLMQSATRHLEGENRDEAARFYLDFASMLLSSRGSNGAWRLQFLTDLSTLPDYDEAFSYYGGEVTRAPVNADGVPVFHKLPRSWKDAATDGQRWRWCLKQAEQTSTDVASQAQFTFASFLYEQFDVRTLQGGYSPLFGRQLEDDSKSDTGAYAVSTLAEDETIACLASGIKRLKLPDEFNYIKIFQSIAEGPHSYYAHQSVNHLAQIFEDRQQYDRAAEYWKRSIKTYGPGNENEKQKRVDQILGNWGLFDPIRTSPAGKPPRLGFVFRNGAKVSFEAYELKVTKVLDDVREYLKSGPARLQGERLNVEEIGQRIVTQHEMEYRGERVAEWTMDLKPREKHFDKRVYVEAPLKKPGAYLVRAKMEGGNTTNIVVWVADTVILKKPLDHGWFCYVADAITGQPVPGVKVDAFGFRQRQIADNQYKVETRQFTSTADDDGSLKLSPEQADADFQWILTATGGQGRFAFLGFSTLWSGQYQHDREYNQQKVFGITDRPVYRPGQPVKFKLWAAQAQYDHEGKSAYAGRSFSLIVRDPRNEKVFEKSFIADDLGGFDGEFTLNPQATLGNYSLQIDNAQYMNFRVEEYKKPEFEVKVDAPTEPVMLGDKITATITSKYYFGSPVTQATVKYRVVRSSYQSHWYPAGRWDWFYEPGYWWFAEDYPWFPGWGEWGCARPHRSWIGSRSGPPEIVAQSEVPVGPDGTVKFEIDTAVAKALHSDTDHQYSITAEVTDQSRRTIVGQGTVSVARRPFKVYAWVDRGHYQVGDAVQADFSAQTLDNKPVKGKGELKLFKVTYVDGVKPIEETLQTWPLNTDDAGKATQKLKAEQPGQYRLSYTVTDEKNRAIEGAYVFTVRGDTFTGKEYRFNDLELVTDKREYAAGDTVRMMVNTNRDNGAVLLFMRPANGIYLPPKLLRLKGKSTIEEIAVVKKDMPNFFVEAVTISDGKIAQELREVVVPPEDRVVNVEVLPSAQEYKPGEQAKVKVKLTGPDGKPAAGSVVVSIYDKSVEYISAGSNVQDIRSFFWKWRRTHYPNTNTNLTRGAGPISPPNELSLEYIGCFGSMVADLHQEGDQVASAEDDADGFSDSLYFAQRDRHVVTGAASLAGRAKSMDSFDMSLARSDEASVKAPAAPTASAPGAALPPGVEPTVRTNFADTALWSASLTANEQGLAEVELKMPENLTTWKARVWSMGLGTRVGQGEAEVVTRKNLLVRLQAPRFFVQKDEVVLSANVHNYLKDSKSVQVRLELDGPCLQPIAADDKSQSPTTTLVLPRAVQIDSNAEQRLDWRVKVASPGTAIVRVKAITDEESDAVQMQFPVYIHGMLKTDSYSGALRADEQKASLTINVPKERRVEDSRLEIRYSPSVAAAMVDALPYLVDYPYGCTEQTLNRFVPTVITQKVLLTMKLDLKSIAEKRTNLNAQEIGNDVQRAGDWARNNPPNPGAAPRNPVFDEAEVKTMVAVGVQKLQNMQLSDGGWGWFSGYGEQSAPHTTALVVHGLQVARENDAKLSEQMLTRDVEWLKQYQSRQVTLLKNWQSGVDPRKEFADNLDAFVYMVLADAGVQDKDMLEFCYRDRTHLSVYAKAMFGLALHKQQHKEKLQMILQNISQYVVEDGENQTAYLKLPDPWWCWYGTDTEAMGYYLKLLARTDPKSQVASRMSKYLINNRKHASYWNSTRDTAVVIEALADFLKASGEDKPDMTVTLSIDGKKAKEAKIDGSNLFSFDNKLVITGADVPAGEHKIEFAKAGTGPLYFNAYSTNFTLEDPIAKAGLEIKVDRKFYKLLAVDKTIKAAGDRGQALDQKVEKYERQPLTDLATLKSGDLVEVELEIDSKNDYEYIIFEDMKAAGFEPVDVRSGYNGNDLNAYMELRDERVCFFTPSLARGKHSVSYRLRAEVPGRFSALPTRASAMYAPELRANSDEMKLNITD